MKIWNNFSVQKIILVIECCTKSNRHPIIVRPSGKWELITSASLSRATFITWRREGDRRGCKKETGCTLSPVYSSRLTEKSNLFDYEIFANPRHFHQQLKKIRRQRYRWKISFQRFVQSRMRNESILRNGQTWKWKSIYFSVLKAMPCFSYEIFHDKYRIFRSGSDKKNVFFFLCCSRKIWKRRFPVGRLKGYSDLSGSKKFIIVWGEYPSDVTVVDGSIGQKTEGRRQRVKWHQTLSLTNKKKS